MTMAHATIGLLAGLVLGCNGAPSTASDAGLAEDGGRPGGGDGDAEAPRPEVDGGNTGPPDAGPPIADGGASTAIADLYATDFEDPSRDVEWDAYGPAASVTLSSTQQHIMEGCGRDGSRCLRLDVSGGSRYNRVGFVHRDRRAVQRGFFRYAFRCGSGCDWDVGDNNIKLHRFMLPDLASWYGTVKVEGAFAPFWEGGESGLHVGLAWGTARPEWRWNENPVSAENLADGAWHTLEVEYDVAAGPDARMRYWIDDSPVVLAEGAGNWGGGPAPGTRYVAADDGGPSWIVMARGDNPSSGVAGVTFLEMISNAASAGVLFVDDVAASTTPIGPRE